jgi:puromycin-sensitive aminopeptidase
MQMVQFYFFKKKTGWLQFTSDEKGDEVEEFFATRTKPFIARTIKQSIERVHNNANWASSIKKDNSLRNVVNELLSAQSLM